MSEIPISPNIWKLADAILTEKQKTVLELREQRGYSWNQLAITFNCTRANVREHHAAATRNLLNAIEDAGSIEMALAKAVGPPTASPPKPSDSLQSVLPAQPRPASEETPEEVEITMVVQGEVSDIIKAEETLEEKTELDRIWKESA